MKLLTCDWVSDVGQILQVQIPSYIILVVCTFQPILYRATHLNFSLFLVCSTIQNIPKASQYGQKRLPSNKKKVSYQIQQITRVNHEVGQQECNGRY